MLIFSDHRRERGAVAVITAISAIMLMGFGALAVDLGNAWARKRAIQTTADLAALAGAAALPDVQQARELAVKYLERNREPIGDADYTCPLTAGASCWDNDGDYGNGEIDFYSDDLNGDGRYTDGVDVNGNGSIADDPHEMTSGNKALAIRVVPPSSRVDFGLAAAIGMSAVDVTEPATAALGSAYGLGVPPFYLVAGDFGQTCIKDDSPGGAHSVVPRWAIKTSHSVTTIEPGRGPAGTLVTIFGVGLPTSGGSAVFSDGTSSNKGNGDVKTRSATGWTVEAPDKVTGTVNVTIKDGSDTAESSGTFRFTDPNLTSLAPTAGDVGSTVEIDGSELPVDNSFQVYFGSTPATASLRTAAKWEVSVPSGVSGTVPVTLRQGSWTSNALDFSVNAPPAPTPPHLDSIDPSSGPVGFQVTIHGTNLGAGTVFFGSFTAPVVSRTSTQVVVTVPAGITTPGNNQVTVNNGSASNALDFEVVADDDPCFGYKSERGYIDEPREDANSAVDVNIEQGIDHNLHNWMKWPDDGTAPRPEPPVGEQCDNDTSPPDQFITRRWDGDFSAAPDVNCLDFKTGSTGGALKKGFFGQATLTGRLYRSCGGPTDEYPGFSDVDGNRLFDDPTDGPSRFIDTAKGPSNALMARINAGQKATTDMRGWINSEILTCPRFAILPIINAVEPPDPGSNQIYKIIGFGAMYFDDEVDGVHGFVFGHGNSLDAVRGYAFDINYLPEQVDAAHAGQIGEYVDGLPKVAYLVHDQDDPAT